MKTAFKSFKDALGSKKIVPLTKALNELAEESGWQLRPPHSEILKFRATEENEFYEVSFKARVSLHYSNREKQAEGIVFTMEFSGDAYADSPNPAIDELFYAGQIDSITVYAYGTHWKGETIQTPKDFAENLEVPSETLTIVPIGEFLENQQWPSPERSE